jgi:ATP-binding cassette subfamily F protein uup
MALLSLKNVSLSYGGNPLLDDVEFHIERGDRICLLGVNGTGKSTMLRVLAGESKPDSGQVIRASGIRVTRLPQQVPTHLCGRVLDIVCPDHENPDHAREALEARQILTRLDLDEDADFATLSGGTRRRVLLAQTLAGNPDVVMLDEPTNHLDLDSIAWLESYLLRRCKTFLFISHDRSFLRRIASRVVELDRGHLSDWNCDYDTFLVRKDEALQAEALQWNRLDKKLEKEEAWRRRGVKARTVRNQGRLRALESLRSERRQRRERTGAVQMSIQEADRTGQIVIKADKVTFGYGATPLIRDFTTVITRGDRIGIIGPNGCGKTTLLNLLLNPSFPSPLAGAALPQSSPSPLAGEGRGEGSCTHGTNLQIAYSDQLRAQLDENKSLAENIVQGKEFVMLQGVKRHVISYLEDFLFTPDRARAPVSVLSGGERNRLLLARLFAQPSNVMVLDEPTNDLDLDTLDLLEDQLDTYSGTVLVVSHDRAFLNNVATSVLVFEKHPADTTDQWLKPDEGWYVNEYVGGYDDWNARRVLPPEPTAPDKAQAPKATTPSRRKLSFKERRELEELPSRIESMEEEQTQWHACLADPVFFRKPKAEVTKATERSEALASELEVAYRRWAELEALAAT